MLNMVGVLWGVKRGWSPPPTSGRVPGHPGTQLWSGMALLSPPTGSTWILWHREGDAQKIIGPSTDGNQGQSWLCPPTTEEAASHPPRAGRGANRHLRDLRVSIGNSNPSHGARVTAQEEEGDVASCGHQVDEHGHPDGPEGGKTELLHQEAAQEDPQTGTWDCSHPWENRGTGMSARNQGQCVQQAIVPGWGLSPAQTDFRCGLRAAPFSPPTPRSPQRALLLPSGSPQKTGGHTHVNTQLVGVQVHTPIVLSEVPSWERHGWCGSSQETKADWDQAHAF